MIPTLASVWLWLGEENCSTNLAGICSSNNFYIMEIFNYGTNHRICGVLFEIDSAVIGQLQFL